MTVTAAASANPAPPAGPRAEAVQFEKERGVSQVTTLPGVAHVRVLLDAEDVAAGRLALLRRLAGASVPVFLVKLQPDGLSFALREANVEAGASLLQQAGVPHVIYRDLALLSILAGAMRDLSGVMAAIYQALVSEGIAVRQTGDAYNAVHCLVAGEDAARAAEALRVKFALLPSPDAGEGEGQKEGVGLKAL